MKTGILGGTFDPVHNGHIKIALGVCRQLKLDEMLFVPAAISPFKVETCETPVRHRVRMVELAIAGIPGFSISRIEADRPGTSYTVDTLESLKNRSGKASELFFIIGLDSLRTLPEWKSPDRIISLCRLVTVRRPGYEFPDIERLETRIPGLLERLTILAGPLVDVSSTDIRRRISTGQDIAGMVPPAVEEYIRKNNLYKPEGK